TTKRAKFFPASKAAIRLAASAWTASSKLWLARRKLLRQRRNLSPCPHANNSCKSLFLLLTALSDRYTSPLTRKLEFSERTLRIIPHVGRELFPIFVTLMALTFVPADCVWSQSSNAKKIETPSTVKFTDIRKQSGITF